MWGLGDWPSSTQLPGGVAVSFPTPTTTHARERDWHGREAVGIVLSQETHSLNSAAGLPRWARSRTNKLYSPPLSVTSGLVQAHCGAPSRRALVSLVPA